MRGLKFSLLPKVQYSSQPRQTFCTQKKSRKPKDSGRSSILWEPSAYNAPPHVAEDEELIEEIFKKEKPQPTSAEFDMLMNQLLLSENSVATSMIHKDTTPEEFYAERMGGPIERFRTALEGVSLLQQTLNILEDDDWSEKYGPELPPAPAEDSVEYQAMQEIDRLTMDTHLPEEVSRDFELPIMPPVPSLEPDTPLPPCHFCYVLHNDKFHNGKRGLERFYLFNPMNMPLWSRYLSGNGAILPRSVTGTCARHQRKVSKVIKKAIHMGFLSWKHSSFVINSPFALPPELAQNHLLASRYGFGNKPEPERIVSPGGVEEGDVLQVDEDDEDFDERDR